METLQEIWADLKAACHETDKGSIHSYIDVYATELGKYRGTAKNVLEVGLFNGASMRMWEQYFTNAKIFGIDCDEQPHGGLADLRPMIAEGTHNIYIGDAESPVDIERFFKGIKFDVIIEDAGHHIEQQLQIYKILKPYLNDGAIYLIEDIQDIYATKFILENIDHEKEVTILDRRNIKHRYDDVLVIIKDKK